MSRAHFLANNLPGYLAKSRIVLQHAERGRDATENRNKDAIALDAAHDPHHSIAGILYFAQAIGKVFRHAKRIQNLHGFPPARLETYDCIVPFRLELRRLYNRHCAAPRPKTNQVRT